MDDRQQLHNISSKFTVFHCPDSSTTSSIEPAGIYAGWIVVRKLHDLMGCSPAAKGDAYEGGPPLGRLSPMGASESLALEAELGVRFGPDELEVILSGAEVLALDVTYHEACTYWLAYNVGAAGSYNVSIRQIRDRYQALNEIEPA